MKRRGGEGRGRGRERRKRKGEGKGTGRKTDVCFERRSVRCLSEWGQGWGRR